MNAHIPQSYEAAVELGSIAAVQHQIITPRDSKPVIGVVQDTLVGAYRLTRPGNLFNKREFFNLMMWNKRFDGQMKEPAEQGKWSGSQVMSTLLPPLNLTMKNKLYNDAADADKAYEDRVNVIKIKEGEVLQGTFDKDVFSKAGKGIIHVTYNDYGSQDTVTLLDTLQNTIEQFLIYDGFSVGISDLVADDSTRQRMEEEINLRKKKIEEIILQVHQDTFNNNTGKTNRAEFEDRVFTAINEATNVAGKIGLQSLAEENRMTAMIRAGSKGSQYNVAQMIACVGQQGIEGKRVPYGFTDRTLPHFKKYDDGGEARGFIESSFVRGLTPSEFFFHAMSGREGLIDTAVKTADTGYIQRQLVKSMEDLITHFDGSVRDAKGNIIQFHYGEDGISATKIEGQGLPLSKMTEEDIRKTFSLEGIDFTPIMSEGAQRNADEDTEKLAAYVEQVLDDRKMLVETMFGFSADTSIMSPVNLERILTNLKVRFGLKSNGTTDLTPLYVLNGIDNIISRTQSHNVLWKALLRFHLSPHNLIVRDRFTKKAFDTLLEFILLRNWKSWAIPGEQVGIIAAQSIGEPATQMSVTFASRIVINSKNTKYAGQIGPFIDALLEKEKDRVIDIGNNSVVLDLIDNLQILGVSTDEKTSWKNISQISRHPANGGLVEIVTRSGRKTTATLSHSFLKRSPEGVVPVLGSDLKVGMRVPVAKIIPEVPHPISSTLFTLNKEFGWVCGIYLADGSFNGNTVKITKIAPIVETKLKQFSHQYSLEFNIKQYQGQYGPGKDNNIKSKELKEFLQSTFGTGSYEKFIGSLVYHAPVEFIRGVIGGFFDGDGNVNPEKQLIRASSRSKPLIQGINHLLGYCAMFGIMGSEESVRIPDKTQHTLMIPRKYAEHYKNTIGFELEEKSAALDEIIEYNNRDDVHSHMELIDKIPELGEIIATTGKLLRMPGCSRTYGRWTKKESIGRRTLQEYIQNFKDMLDVHVDSTVVDEVNQNIRILESAADADVLWDEIVEINYLPDPQQFVYDFTVPGNETFMVDDGILVHNTLNSVDWDTKIIIAKNGKIMTPQIGEFIDTYYESCEDNSRIQHLPNEQIYIDLKDGNDWKAVSCGEDGKMVWTKLEAITRHPVVNDDGSDTILEVELDSGRTVKATKGKSFLTLIDGKVQDINGCELKVGDVLPIANSLALDQLESVESINLREYLSPTEWLYGAEVEKALREIEKGDRHWFQENNGKVFTVPYSRSDGFRDAFLNNRNSNTIIAGNVYPKRTRPDISQIPETIPLTKEFGFFAGAYLAEGMANTTQVNITNNDQSYFKKVESLMTSWNVGTHIVCEEREAKKTGIKGLSTSLVIHSTILATVMRRLFGRVSNEKTLPDWVFQAPDEFVQGLVDAYISGDGTVDKKLGCISATSVSKDLLTRFRTLLSRYGIFGRITSNMPDIGKFDSVQKNYTLHLRKLDSKKFADQFTLSIETKQEILHYHMQLNYEIRPNTKSYKSLNDMIFDTIVSIKEVRPIKGWVYDLTVESTRNFTALDGIACKDTFHLAGVAAKSNVTRGVPRLKELLKVTKNPKATTLTVYLKPEFRESREKAREVSQDLELTLLKDITAKAATYYDPKINSTVLEEDKELLAFYNLFEERLKEASAVKGEGEGEGEGEAEAEETTEWSRWMLRLEFDREKMFNKNISMDDIAFVLNTHFGEEVNMVYSDYNSQKLIMRIRIVPQSAGKGESSLDDLVLLKKFQNKILNGIVIRGITGIKSAPFRFLSQELEQFKVLKDGKYETIQEYVLDTDGSNFLDVTNHPSVDGSRVISSHVHDVLPYLGIEAARATLIAEMTSLFSEIGINYRHVGLLTDVMTRGGRLMSIDRYGINKMDIGPLAKASFEETEKILLRAAVFGEMDPVTGVSANIMTGQAIRGGTAFSQILLDETMFMKLQETIEDIGREEEKDDELDEDLIYNEIFQDPNDRCSTTRLRMNMVLPNADVQIDEEDIAINIID